MFFPWPGRYILAFQKAFIKSTSFCLEVNEEMKETTTRSATVSPTQMNKFQRPRGSCTPPLKQTCSWLVLAISMETIENQLSHDTKKKASAHVINLETGVSSCCEWTVN